MNINLYSIGLVYNSVGTLRYAPSYSAELVSQALLGTVVKILEEREGWMRVMTPDGYVGWVQGSIKAMTKNELDDYYGQPKVIVTNIYTRSYEKDDEDSLQVSDLVIGNILVVKSETDRYFEVVYPDGRKAFIKSSDARKLSYWLDNCDLNGESIVNTAYKFMGVPYLWGGTSSKGLDCSGLTKIVYFMHGIILFRDASQQVNQGQLVDSGGDFSKLISGDLIFFGSKSNTTETTEDNIIGERVVHVGIYIGNNHFIHASDYVHVSSLDPQDALYDAFNAGRYLRTKRYIVNGDVVNVNKFEL